MHSAMWLVVSKLLSALEVSFPHLALDAFPAFRLQRHKPSLLREDLNAGRWKVDNFPVGRGEGVHCLNSLLFLTPTHFLLSSPPPGQECRGFIVCLKVGGGWGR